MQSYNRLSIDLSAIQANLSSIKARFSTPRRLMPMVKAAAYGMNDLTLANFYQKDCGVDIVGVSHIHEAVSLRERGFMGAIFLIGSSTLDVSTIVNYNIEASIDHLALCELLSKEAEKQKKKIKVHLHLNTGMQRFGCRIEEAVAIAQLIASLPGLIFEGIFTHFIAAESSDSDHLSSKQSLDLEMLLSLLNKEGITPRWVHAANSAGALRFDLPFCNMMRIGLAALGLYSSENEKKALQLKPSLKLESTLIAINRCFKGETVGYSQCYTVQKEQENIAIIPIGYYDGIHLNYSGKGYVLIHGKPAPMVGRICMDFMMVDITNIPQAKVGDSVLIFGEDAYGNRLPPETVASWGTSNIRELITCLGPRIHRNFIYKEINNDTDAKRICKTVCSL